jgi:uncharacterized LabA/DUF88 family protein
MSYEHPSQRVGVFVDVQNVYHSAKNLYHARVNFKELLHNIVGHRSLVRAFAYVAKSDTAIGEESFFEALRKSNFDLRVKDLQIYPDGTKKGDWDVGLAVDAIRYSPMLDVIILVTGDGDFIPLVEYLKVGMGHDVEIAGFGHTSSGKLKEIATKFTEIERIPKVLLKIKDRDGTQIARNRNGQRNNQT